MLNVSYMRLENNVCTVGAKLFLTHQKPSRPLQLTQMEGYRLGGKQWASVKKTDLSLSIHFQSFSLFLNNSLLRHSSARIWLGNRVTQLTLKTAHAQRQFTSSWHLWETCICLYQWWKSQCGVRCSRLPWCSMVNITIACSLHEDITLTDILSVSQAVKLVTWRCDFTLWLLHSGNKPWIFISGNHWTVNS